MRLEMAAHLACGASSVVSHRSAAVLWQLLAEHEHRHAVEILVRARERHRPGIVVRRAVGLRNDEVTKLDGIPVTTAARTIVDLATSASARELEQALAQSLARRLTTRGKLERVLERANGRRGSVLLRALLHGEAALTRSEAEERLLRLVRKAQLPEPATNACIAGWEVDFLWRDARLVVEVDGYAFHADATAFEKDRQRDFALEAARPGTGSNPRAIGAVARATLTAARHATDSPVTDYDCDRLPAYAVALLLHGQRVCLESARAIRLPC
jgi:hypothetical protein